MRKPAVQAVQLFDTSYFAWWLRHANIRAVYRYLCSYDDMIFSKQKKSSICFSFLGFAAGSSFCDGNPRPRYEQASGNQIDPIPLREGRDNGLHTSEPS